jgi:hemerythrin
MNHSIGAADAELSPLQWTTAMVCGSGLIDDQHRTLLQEANDLLEASRRKAPDTLSRFDELISHVLGHFQDEEALLRIVGYVDYEKHRRLHGRLAETALALRDEMLEHGPRHAKLLAFLVHDVVQEHLLQDDRAFFPAIAAHLRESGAAGT